MGGKKSLLVSVSCLTTASFHTENQREYVFIFTQGSLNQPLPEEVGSQLKDACCSDFLNVQLIRFTVTNRPGVRADNDVTQH